MSRAVSTNPEARPPGVSAGQSTPPPKLCFNRSKVLETCAISVASVSLCRDSACLNRPVGFRRTYARIVLLFAVSRKRRNDPGKRSRSKRSFGARRAGPPQQCSHGVQPDRYHRRRRSVPSDQHPAEPSPRRSHRPGIQRIRAGCRDSELAADSGEGSAAGIGRQDNGYGGSRGRGHPGKRSFRPHRRRSQPDTEAAWWSAAFPMRARPWRC